jgi:hypothetical protein
MTPYVPPVRRKDYKRYHIYLDGNNTRIPGVTTILGAVPKPNLISWAATATAEGAVNRWDELADLPAAARYKALERIRYDTVNEAKNRGTDVHRIAEQIVQGQEVADIPDIIAPHIENYIRFIDTYELEPILVEVVVVHYNKGYAGTLDLVGDLTNPATKKRERWLLDIKTGEKGIFAETALQLAAYRNAQFYVDNDHHEQPMIPVDACGAINVTADDAALVPVITDDDDRIIAGLNTFQLFQIAQRMYAYEQDKDGLIMPATRTETTSKYRLIREDQQS